VATKAERQRQYRKRQARGVGVYRVPTRFDVVEALIDAGRISEEESLDQVAVGDALSRIAVEWAVKYFVMRNA
jgi:hypothetical protein